MPFAFPGGGYGGAFPPVEGAIMAFGGVFAFLAAANAWNESSQDRTYGLFALLGAVGGTRPRRKRQGTEGTPRTHKSQGGAPRRRGDVPPLPGDGGGRPTPRPPLS